MNMPVSPLYTFKNFTKLTKQESNEVLHGSNDPEVRRWENAQAELFLTLDAASFFNGQVTSVNGGNR